VSQPYGPSRPVTGIALPLQFLEITPYREYSKQSEVMYNTNISLWIIISVESVVT
jgi:hypothetical protein